MNVFSLIYISKPGSKGFQWGSNVIAFCFVVSFLMEWYDYAVCGLLIILMSNELTHCYLS